MLRPKLGAKTQTSTRGQVGS